MTPIVKSEITKPFKEIVIETLEVHIMVVMIEYFKQLKILIRRTNSEIANQLSINTTLTEELVICLLQTVELINGN